MNEQRPDMRPRVVFLARPDLLTNPGGDTTQILSTREQLERMGLHVRLLLADPSCAAIHRAEIGKADAVHCFNLLLSYQYESLIHHARSLGKPVLLSPIFWDMEAYEREGHSIPVWKRLLLAALASDLGTPLHGILTTRLKSVTYNPRFRERLSSILRDCDMLLPNSEVEGRLLQHRFGVDVAMHLVWNACRGGADAPPVPADAPPRYALCVGRIERRKNQLLLIRAAASLDLPVVLIGAVNLAEKSYWRQCRRAAARLRVRVIHIEATGWEQVWPYYAHAAVHAQPSWFETPGLSSLEAAAAGCPIVCTDQGSAREYFADMAEYCSPRSETSLREALVRALSGSGREARSAFVRERYTWEKAAEMTLQAYVRAGLTVREEVFDAVA